MTGKYYPIDEEAVKRAQAMWSFREYVTGTKTKEYQRLVDEAYQLADDVAGRYPDRAESVYILADKYAKKLADNFNKDSHINLRCPSVLIAGPANFPLRKKNSRSGHWRKTIRNIMIFRSILTESESLGMMMELLKVPI